MGLIPLFVVIPLAAAFIIPLLGRITQKLTDITANLATLAVVVLSLAMLKQLAGSGFETIVYDAGGWKPPVGVCMVMDGLSILMLVTVNIIAFAATLFSVGYMERYTAKWKYYTLFMLMLAGMNAVIVSGDMFNLYVFLEVSAFASYSLVAFGCEHEELEASFKYVVLGSIASLLILLGIALLYSRVSSLNMADISGLIGSAESTVVMFITVLFIMGFGLKSAAVPFHAWLPDAHPSAPAPISAMLSGVLIKVLGIYAMARILFNVLGAGIL